MSDDEIDYDEIEIPGASIVDSPTARAYRGVEIERSRVYLDAATHSVPISVVEEVCTAPRCEEFATHKVGDQSGPESMHELTTYLCCRHMRAMGMNCDLYGAF